MNVQSLRPILTDNYALAWLAWIGFAVGILGILLSYYFYVRNRNWKRPYCLTFTHAIAGRMLTEVPDFRITYKGKPVPRLAVTKLVFWNAGTDTIQAVDVPAAAPFAVSIADDAQFLNYKLDFVKKDANAVTLAIDKDLRRIDIAFDYFDKNDGFVVELLHTGKSDSAIALESVFKGAQPLVRRSAAALLSLPKPIRQLLASERRSVAGLFLMFTALISFSNQHFHYLPKWLQLSRPPSTDFTGYLAEFIVYGGALFVGAYLFRTRLPKGFDLNW